MNWTRIEHFRRNEFVCPCCNQERMQEGFMLTMDAIRKDYGSPIMPSSGYRCPAYNDEISSTGRNGPHTTGSATDIPIYGAPAIKLLDSAMKHGITGIGIKQTGPYPGRFIHLDTLTATSDRPRPWIWSYT